MGKFGKDTEDGFMIHCNLFGWLVYDKSNNKFLRSQDCIESVIKELV